MKLENLSLKGALAFFLVCVSAFMVILWMLHPPVVDAGTAALLASFVTMFIKMAADAIGYQYNSSAGSDKKDDTQAKVASTLAAAVVPPPAPTNGAPVIAWWSLLTDAEKAAINAARADARVQSFVDRAQTGKADAADLDYLVARGLLMQGRADAIKAG